MKLEPLKGKSFCVVCQNYSEKPPCNKHYKPEDIRSAVELLLSQIDDLYHKFPKGKIWRLNTDEICDMIEEYVKKNIENDFEDVLE